MAKRKIFVSTNVASTLDGKIAPANRGAVKFSSPYDSRRMSEIRAEVDCVMMGATTYRAYPRPLLVGIPALVRKRAKQGLTPQPATVIVSSRLDLPRGTRFEKAESVRRIIFTTKKSPAKARARYEKLGIEVVVAPGKRPSAAFMLRELEKRGLPRVLVEGGGELLSAFFETDLVDRIFLTICPTVLGGKDAPTMSEGKGLTLENRAHFRLKECRRRGHELYLVYDR